MTSLWTEADRRAWGAIEAELRRRETFSPEGLREAYGRIGTAVSIKAMTLWNNQVALADFVRTALPAA